jgi:hypothetical protein
MKEDKTWRKPVKNAIARFLRSHGFAVIAGENRMAKTSRL